VTDSQWLGSFIEGGYYLNLNEYIEADPELQAVMKDLHPVLISAYSTYPHIPAAELQVYPDPNANYYGFPQMPDTYVTWYREDLFCNEKEQANFQAAYDKTLPCTYADWEDVDWETFEQIGEFFHRAKGDELGDGVADDDFYGIAYQAGKGYDFSTMSINAFIWQYVGNQRGNLGNQSITDGEQGEFLQRLAQRHAHLEDSDGETADDIHQRDDDAGDRVAAHEFAGTVHRTVEIGLGGDGLSPLPRLRLVDQTGGEVGVDRHLLAGHGIEREPGRHLAHAGRAFRDHHELDDYEDDEDDRADDD
jgi:hypothetical protein